LSELAYFCQMIKVVLLGAGNVAHHLFTAFMHQESVAVVQCYNRKGILLGPSSEATLVTNNINAIIDADIYILAISDDAFKINWWCIPLAV